MNSDEKKIALVLLFLRLSLGVFLICVSVGFFADPVGTLKVWNQLYPIHMSGSWVPPIGVSLMALSLLFTLGAIRPISYNVLFFLQFITVIASFKSILNSVGGEMINRISFLYYASGIPILACFFVLFLLRHYDQWSVDERFKHFKY